MDGCSYYHFLSFGEPVERRKGLKLETRETSSGPAPDFGQHADVSVLHSPGNCATPFHYIGPRTLAFSIFEGSYIAPFIIPKTHYHVKGLCLGPHTLTFAFDISFAPRISLSIPQ